MLTRIWNWFWPPKPPCQHEHKSEPVRTVRRDEGICVIYDWLEKCPDCGYTNSTDMEVEYRPGGEDAMDRAWDILRELEPAFDNAGSGCKIYYPPAVATVYLGLGREAAVRKAKELLGRDDHNEADFQTMPRVTAS